MGIKIPINAELNQQDLNDQLKQVQAAFNSLGQAAEKAGHIKFAPISKMSLDDATKMRKEFETMVRLSPGLRKSLESAGQDGLTFDKVNWDKVWTDPTQRSRHAQTMVGNLGPDQIETVLPSQPQPSGTRKKSSGAGQRAFSGAAAGIAGGVASQVGGLAGGVASGALAGGLAGGPLGAAIGAFTGAISSLLGSLGEAKDIAVSVDALKRQLGDVNVSFSDLKANTRDLADEFSLTDTEATALTSRYARQAGSNGSDPAGLRDEVGVGVGFSRSYGLDPSAGVDFFSQMRGIGVTKSADDSKRLALAIGESVARAGQFSRMSEVLGGLSRYMENNARTSLSGNGASAWLSRLAGLQNLDLPGMTPGNGANMIGTIDASIRAGGTTAASKNFMSSVLMRQEDLNPIQAAIQLEGGAFGTGRSAFGSNSAMSRLYGRDGGGVHSSVWTDDRTNLSMLQEALEKNYAGRTDLKIDAFSNTFGLNKTQSAAWLASDPVKNDALGKRMQHLGIDIKSVNSDGIARMANIEANTGLSSADKDAQVREAAAQHQEKTEGSEARKASIDGANAMVRLADNGLPMLSDIQAGILKIAGLDPLGLSAKRIDKDHWDKVEGISSKEGKALSEARNDYEKITPLWQRLSGQGLSDDQQFAKDRVTAAQDDYNTAMESEKMRWRGEKGRNVTDVPGQLSGVATPAVLARAAEEDKRYGFEPGTTAGLMAQESSFNSNAESKAGAKGLFQIMPSNVRELSRRSERQLDPTNTEDGFYMYEQLMDELKEKHGKNTDMMLREYNGGWNQENWGKENQDYVPAIHRRMKEMQEASAASSSSGGAQTVDHNVSVNVKFDANGNPIADPALVTTTVYKPAVSGGN
jgi:hypothetical protein